MKSVHDKIKSEPHQISQREVNDFLDLEKSLNGKLTVSWTQRNNFDRIQIGHLIERS